MCKYYTRLSCVRFHCNVLAIGEMLVHANTDDRIPCGGRIAEYIHPMTVIGDGLSDHCEELGRFDIGVVYCSRCDKEPELNGRPIHKSQLLTRPDGATLLQTICPRIQNQEQVHHGRV